MLISQRGIRTTLTAALTLGVIVGCTRRPDPVALPAPAAPPDTTNTAAVDSARARAAREAAEREAADRRDAQERAERARVSRVMQEPVYFAFDRSDLTVEARANLDAKLALMRSNSVLRIRVEGHADEQGASEYNLALGMRRAAAVRRYFVQREIAESRVEVTSFGEEQPVCRNQDESCRGLNRRADFALAR